MKEGFRKEKKVMPMQLLTFHYQTNALPVSKQWLLPPQNPPSLSSYCWARHYRECTRPLVYLGQLCPLPTSCSPSAYLLGRQSWEKRQPGQHASTAQQQLKLGCVFTVLEHQTTASYVAVHMWLFIAATAAMNKIISIPDRSGTVFQ